MKKIILILAVITLIFSCKKNSRTASPTSIVYCMSTDDGGIHIKRGCATTKEEVQQKAIEMRNAGYTVFNSVEKSTCTDCN